MSEIARLRWRCRRGMKEIDVLLLDYLDHDWTQAVPAEREAFEELLAMQDPELMSLLLGRTQADNDMLQALVERLRHPVSS